MSVRAKTGRRRAVHRFISNLLLWAFVLQNGAVAQVSPAFPPTGPGYQVFNPVASKADWPPSAQDVASQVSSPIPPASIVVPESEPPHDPENPAATAISAFVVHTLLWPPNHEMWDIGLAVTASDGSGSTLALSVRAYSDEPANDTGDGDKAPDALIDAPNVLMRAERKGNADGRVYLAVVTAAGDAGTAIACVNVVVPKSNTAASIANVRAQADAAQATCEQTGSAPGGFFLIGEGSGARSRAPGGGGRR